MPQITYLGFFAGSKIFKRTVNNPAEFQTFIGDLQRAAITAGVGSAGVGAFGIVSAPEQTAVVTPPIDGFVE